MAYSHLCQKLSVECSPNHACRGPGLGPRWNLSRVDDESPEGSLCHCLADVVCPKGKVKGTTDPILRTLVARAGEADDQDARAVHWPRKSDEHARNQRFHAGLAGAWQGASAAP